MSEIWTWPVAVRREKDGSYHTYSKDFPEAIASGGTRGEALAEMELAFAAAVRGRIADEMDLPSPRAAGRGEATLFLPPGLAAKASVYAAWRRSKLSKSALAKRMGRNEGEVRRILDPWHGTKIDQLAEAARALGGHLTVGFDG